VIEVYESSTRRGGVQGTVMGLKKNLDVGVYVRAVGCSSNKAPSSKTKQSSELEDKIIERFRELLYNFTASK
jgi:hypothetical protein